MSKSLTGDQLASLSPLLQSEATDDVTKATFLTAMATLVPTPVEAAWWQSAIESPASITIPDLTWILTKTPRNSLQKDALQMMTLGDVGGARI